jgi:hypothetical protein
MHPMPPPSWTKLAAAMRDKAEETLDRLADAIKDSVIDWERAEPMPGERPVLDWLPPVPEERLAEALRDRLADALHRLAEAVNEVRPGDPRTATREELCEQFAALAWEAFEVGVQLRLDAAVAELAGAPAAPGAWVEKYRRMRATEAAFPLSGGDSEG